MTVIIKDDTHLPPGPITMHFVFYRMGQPVDGTEGTRSLEFAEQLSTYTVYSSKVDFGVSNINSREVMSSWSGLKSSTVRDVS